MNAVIGAIIENMKNIEIIFEPTIEAFVKDTKHTGDSKEVTVANFIGSFFPSSYAIKKGPIYNLESNSQEIDCVILAPNHPLLLTPKREVILAEGVYAAVEVKPDITTLTNKSEFHRALLQIQSVKKLKRTLRLLDTGSVPDELQRIPSVIFSKKSRTAIETIEYMKRSIKSEAIAPFELPDLIFTMDHGLIYHTTHIEKTIFTEWVKQYSSSYNGERFIHIDTMGENSLTMFLIILLSFRPPEPTISNHIILEYLKDSISVPFHVMMP
jgi:hypothetical protein